MANILSKPDYAFLARSFYYVVFDEAQFFVADALFNPNTGYLLDGLISKYFSSVRIYLSAIFYEALEPIYYSEHKRFENNFFSLYKAYFYKDYMNTDVCSNPNDFYLYAMEHGVFAYSFNRDFSSYNAHFFDDLKELEDAIVSDYLDKAKWLIFVNSRDKWEQFAKRRNSEFKTRCNNVIKALKDACGSSATGIDVELKKPYRDFAVFIDRYSRHKDDVSGETWRKLINNGVLPCKVLIATSVLDNGFSIRDDKVKNVVICTDDKVEFLQKLGRRCILGDQDFVELYNRRVTPESLNVRKRYLERQFEFYDIAYGEIQSPKGEKDQKYQLAEAFKKIWNRGDCADFRYLRFVEKSSNGLEIYANYLARWKILCLKREIEQYEDLVSRYG